MIESTIKTNSENQDIDFPCLMISDGGMIVLFEERGHGMVVTGDSHRPIGDIGKCWGMSNFKPFYGEVTLSQKRGNYVRS